jgi:hypothetical protein
MILMTDTQYEGTLRVQYQCLQSPAVTSDFISNHLLKVITQTIYGGPTVLESHNAGNAVNYIAETLKKIL